jgi:hypothetical protein
LLILLVFFRPPATKSAVVGAEKPSKWPEKPAKVTLKTLSEGPQKGEKSLLRARKNP